jgi:hypothetical protein|tara:strand:+ start:623 stop:838 length:216 start_codon:yes stop_codon:yes gene_type:complete
MELYAYYKWLECGRTEVISYHSTEAEATKEWEIQEAFFNDDVKCGVALVRVDKESKMVNALNAALQGLLPA